MQMLLLSVLLLRRIWSRTRQVPAGSCLWMFKKVLPSRPCLEVSPHQGFSKGLRFWTRGFKKGLHGLPFFLTFFGVYCTTFLGTPPKINNNSSKGSKSRLKTWGLIWAFPMMLMLKQWQGNCTSPLKHFWILQRQVLVPKVVLSMRSTIVGLVGLLAFVSWQGSDAYGTITSKEFAYIFLD